MVREGREKQGEREGGKQTSTVKERMRSKVE